MFWVKYFWLCDSTSWTYRDKNKNRNWRKITDKSSEISLSGTQTTQSFYSTYFSFEIERDWRQSGRFLQWREASEQMCLSILSSEWIFTTNNREYQIPCARFLCVTFIIRRWIIRTYTTALCLNTPGSLLNVSHAGPQTHEHHSQNLSC